MDIRPHTIKPPIERFLALTKINPGSCWEWLGAKGSCGYGQFVLDARRGRQRVRIAPYRFIWEYFNGPMSEGLEPDHICNNRGCVNPEHIEPVTHSENQRRSYQRGRKRSGVHYRTVPKTHCINGHEYTAENSRITSQRTRICRICDRARCKTYQDRRRTKRLIASVSREFHTRLAAFTHSLSNLPGSAQTITII